MKRKRKEESNDMENAKGKKRNKQKKTLAERINLVNQKDEM